MRPCLKPTRTKHAAQHRSDQLLQTLVLGCHACVQLSTALASKSDSSVHCLAASFPPHFRLMLTYAMIGEGRAGLLIQSNLRVACSLAMMLEAGLRLASCHKKGDDLSSKLRFVFSFFTPSERWQGFSIIGLLVFYVFCLLFFPTFGRARCMVLCAIAPKELHP